MHDAAIVAGRKSAMYREMGFPSSYPRLEQEQAEGERRYPMELLLVIVILILLFGGGFGLYRRR
jgi:hypothetical protein